MTVRLAIGATLLAMALITTCWPGIAGKLGVSTIVTLGSCGWHGGDDEDVLRRGRLAVGDLERDDVVAGLRRAGRPRNCAGRRVDRGARGQVDRRVGEGRAGIEVGGLDRELERHAERRLVIGRVQHRRPDDVGDVEDDVHRGGRAGRVGGHEVQGVGRPPGRRRASR